MTGVVLASMVVLALGVAGYYSWLRGVAERDALQDRIQVDALDDPPRSLLEALDRRMNRARWGRRVHTRLLRAGSQLRVVDLSLLVIAGMSLIFYVSQKFISWWFALAFASSVAFAAHAYLNWLEVRRRQRFAVQLAEVARVLSNATSAGLALRSAIQMACEDIADPAGSELKVLSDELAVGTPMNEALSNLHDRLPSRELSLLTRTLIIQARAGGAVVTALRGMSDTLEERKDLRREISTMLSGVVFTGWVVLALGVGALLLLNSITPGTLNRLTTSPIGQLGVVIAGSVYLVGILLIRRTTKIDV